VRGHRGRDEAWRSALIASALNLVVGATGAIAFRRAGILPAWPLVLFACVGAATLIYLLARPHASHRACMVALQLDFAAALICSAAGTEAQARVGDVNEVFRAVQVSTIIVALLTPSTTVGVLWIVLFAASAAIELETWPVAVKRAVPVEEPWLSAGIAIVALALLLHRHRSARLERELADAHTQRATLEQLAMMALAVRDLANTPLQTLTSGVALLRADTPRRQAVLDAMASALAKLGTLNRVLMTFEPYVPAWTGDEGFNAVERIEKLATQ
jgi:hypothetical protein